MVLGLVVYGVYNGTNMATIREWGLKEFVVDTVWGTFLSGLISVGSIYIINKINVILMKLDRVNYYILHYCMRVTVFLTLSDCRSSVLLISIYKISYTYCLILYITIYMKNTW